MDFERPFEEFESKYCNIDGNLGKESLDGKDIRYFFGELLQSMGFVSANDGTVWYALKGRSFFFTVVFHLDHTLSDIYVRVCPLCSALIYPFKNSLGAFYDQRNCSLSACNASYLKPANYVGKLGTLRFFYDLLNAFVIPYIEAFISFKDAPFQSIRNHEDVARFAYMYNDASIFYRTDFVRSALFSSVHDVRSEQYVLRKALVNKDLTIYGKYLQKIELSNIRKLKKLIPELFENVVPLITDDYISQKSVCQCKTTYEYVSELNIHPATTKVTFQPMPMLMNDATIESSVGKIDAENVIMEMFAERMQAKGFKIQEDYPYGVLWQRIVNDTAVQSIWFEWHPYLLDILVFYHPSAKIIVKEYACRQGAVDTKCRYYDLFSLPNLHEHFPNPFSNGTAVSEWKKQQLEFIVSQIVFPNL